MKSLITCLFVFIILFLTGCTKKSDNYYINEAAKALSDNNFLDAITAYDKLVDEYPNSPKAPYALFQTATFYQNKQVAQENLTPTASMEKAVKRFKEVFEKYPNDRLAPQALFMAGFIQGNELKQYPKAKETYNLFLQKYPNSELAKSVNEELGNMGLSPEEIIQKKQESKTNAPAK